MYKNNEKISVVKETKKIAIYGAPIIFVISFILFVIFLDSDFVVDVMFGLIFSSTIMVLAILFFYFGGIVLFLKFALFYAKISKKTNNAYIIIFIPMGLFMFARLFDFNVFFTKMTKDTLSIVLFSTFTILDVICPIINYFLLKKIIKKYKNVFITR
ncbi:hypothetical protein HYW21_05650 [Candidatus Woesearchaeota archaeon]|nr:hypothetical protein [Candidatus Woesearchaeota archaeon]